MATAALSVSLVLLMSDAREPDRLPWRSGIGLLVAGSCLITALLVPLVFVAITPSLRRRVLPMAAIAAFVGAIAVGVQLIVVGARTPMAYLELRRSVHAPRWSSLGDALATAFGRAWVPDLPRRAHGSEAPVFTYRNLAYLDGGVGRTILGLVVITVVIAAWVVLLRRRRGPLYAAALIGWAAFVVVHVFYGVEAMRSAGLLVPLGAVALIAALTAAREPIRRAATVAALVAVPLLSAVNLVGLRDLGRLFTGS
ncbi:MAG: hypothetical protein R2698_10360 [Microthrixaceae bacterium]